MLIRYPERLLCVAFLVVCCSVVECDHLRATSRRAGRGGEGGSSLRSVLQCLRREYTLRATRTDTYGRRCWDVIRATSCWGRCDSYEIPDWRFPYKISIHPVCMHDQRKLRRVRLRHCDPPDVEDELRTYEYYDAESCSCGVCNSSDTFCDWKGHMSHHQKVVLTTPTVKNDYSE